MVMETLRDPFDIALVALPSRAGAGADTSFVLDLLCCLPAILVLVRRCSGQNGTRSAGAGRSF